MNAADGLVPDPYPVRRLASPVDADVVVPGSKSITNRALVCAALADGESRLDGALFADDTWAMIDALRAIGIDVRADEPAGTLVVAGCRGQIPDHAAEFSVNQSGTSARFLAPLVALGRSPVTIDAHQQMRGRPMDDLFSSLQALGASVDALGQPGYLPARVCGPISGGTVALPGDATSQFVSGLMLTGAAVGLQVELTTEPVSRPYLEMTAAVMKAFGAAVETPTDRCWIVGGGYRGGPYQVEPDASAASYFFAAAAITGGRVRVHGLTAASLQGDVGFVDVLARMGCTVRSDHDSIEVSGRARHGVQVDLADLSDVAPTLAVVAALADSPTEVSGIGFIRRKESDRLAGPVTELRRAGVDAEETDDGFVIRPGGALTGASFSTYDDHRMAMAFALLGLVVDGVSVRDPGCVRKTFPNYFSVLEGLG